MLKLWLRTLGFIIVVPGTELILIPRYLVVRRFGPQIDFGSLRNLGLLPMLVGAAVILYCFSEFIRRGHGTPALYDPPRDLVIVGLYRWVRNPQYVGVALVLLGEVLTLQRAILVAYAAILSTAFHLFITLYEEPTLRKLFGASYINYCAAVPRWIPIGSAKTLDRHGWRSSPGKRI